MTFEVFDCNPSVTKPQPLEAYKYQLKSEIPDMVAPFVSTSEDCPIQEYLFSKEVKGMSISEVGLVKIDPE